MKLLLFSFTISLSCFSQGTTPFITNNSKWTRYQYNINGQSVDTTDMKTVWSGDTLIGLNIYSKIENGLSNGSGYDMVSNGYIRYDNATAKLYYLDPSNIEYDITVNRNVLEGDIVPVTTSTIKGLSAMSANTTDFESVLGPNAYFKVVQNLINLDLGTPTHIISYNLYDPDLGNDQIGYAIYVDAEGYVYTALSDPNASPYLYESENIICFKNSNYGRVWNNSKSYLCDNVTNIAELSEADIQIFPNPSNGAITFVSNDLIMGATGRILDTHGKIVEVFAINSSNTQLVLDVNPGIYFVEIQKDNYTVRKKIIVN